LGPRGATSDPPLAHFIKPGSRRRKAWRREALSLGNSLLGTPTEASTAHKVATPHVPLQGPVLSDSQKGRHVIIERLSVVLGFGGGIALSGEGVNLAPRPGDRLHPVYTSSWGCNGLGPARQRLAFAQKVLRGGDRDPLVGEIRKLSPCSMLRLRLFLAAGPAITGASQASTHHHSSFASLRGQWG
jgi:hypothetical protein